MYQLTCDGLPLLDWRDNDMVLVNPKVKLEVNTVGEGSFTIYKNHPHYDKLKKLKSVFEVTDDQGVIFRGRATGDTTDFDHGMMVDMEGAMAYFNDSVVRAFSFPYDFQDDEDYITAYESGNVIEFFLGWLIDNHNSQVQDFQKMKLGTVTVTDPNNYITRSMSEYASTWAVLKAKLFDSSLGGYLCIRYEADGNYIDYLSEFTETNSQEIVFGENLIDLQRQTEASETYSAIVPIGALGLTIEGLEDGDITDDIVKSGDTLYSKKAVEEYGWICAPTSETTWDDVTDDSNLLKKGAQWLANGGVFLNAMEATAVDLHFTAEQAESFHIYKNVNVRSAPHDVAEAYPLAKLEIDLLKPQNTKITVGQSLMTLTEVAVYLQEEAKKRYSKLSKTDEDIRLEVQDEIKKLSASIDMSLESIRLELDGFIDGEEAQTLISEALGEITLSVSSKNGSTTFTLTDGDATISTQTLNLSVDAVNVTGKLKAEQIDATDLNVDAANITGTLTIGQLSSEVATEDQIPIYTSELINNSGYQNASGVVSIIDGVVTADYVNALGVEASTIRGNVIYIKNYSGVTTAAITPGATTAAGLDITSYGNLFLASAYGHFAIDANAAYVSAGSTNGYTFCPGGQQLNLGSPTYGLWSAVYASSATITTSDENLKHDIEDLPDKYIAMMDMVTPKRFKYNNGTSDRYHPGFTAQDVKAAMDANDVDPLEFGGWVKDLDADGNEMYMLRYEEFIAILWAKIKQLEKRINAGG